MMTEKNGYATRCASLYLPEGALSLPRQFCQALGLRGETAAAVCRMAAENRQYCANLRGLEAAMAQGRILEAVVGLCDCQTMALTVELCGIRAVLPREELLYPWDGRPVRDIAAITRVGKPIQFKIQRILRGERGEVTAYLSRRLAQEECIRQYLSRRVPGDLLPIRVTHLEPFGAFADVGCGVISLLPIDAISVSRISHPRDRFHPGQFLPALIRQIDPAAGRITLTHKELLGTWAENAAMFAPCQTVPGIVRSVEEYGIFVELAPNLAGLAEYRADAVPGEGYSVYIKSITPERMKVKLTLIDPIEPGSAEPSPLRYFFPPADASGMPLNPSGMPSDASGMPSDASGMPMNPSGMPSDASGMPGMSGHMTYWRYSPESCPRRIETAFAREGDPLRREEARCC